MRTAMRLDGPLVAIATLHAWCPTASRRAITAWRSHEWQRRRRQARVLQWRAAGRVWAMDFSDAPQPIDGQYGALLHVRDLASHYHLAALPVPRLSSGVGWEARAVTLFAAWRAASTSAQVQYSGWPAATAA